jgi:hypothetical protein
MPGIALVVSLAASSMATTAPRSAEDLALRSPANLADTVSHSDVTVAAAMPPTRIYVDVSGATRPIDPRIYGVSFASPEVLRDLNLPLNRSGGNGASLYNWQADARGTGADFYFESVPASSSITDQFQDGFVKASREGRADPMITIPSIGWTAKLGKNRAKLAGFSVAKYGAQTGTDRDWFPDAGNGVRPDGMPVAGNDPTDAAMAIDHASAAQRVASLVARWGRSQAGGVPYFIIDNEPSLWHVTHRNVRPEGAHAQEIATRTIAIAKAIARSDPTAQIVAPEEWGWGGYFDSGYDQQSRSLGRPDVTLDRSTQTGGLDYLPYLLKRWSAAGHPVNVISVHYYPQGGEYGSDDAGSRDIQLARNVSTRSLWDPNYVDRSWINAKVMLIPRLRAWVDKYYAVGTPIAITEYNWGGENSMSGAIAQADIWGIFGREGLNMAARWRAPRPGSPVYLAMRLMRNYDGRGGAFGDASLRTAGTDSDTLASFAARRSLDGAISILVINKDLDNVRPVRVDLPGMSGSATVYRLVSGKLANPTAIQLRQGQLHDTLPAQSIALYVTDNGAS